MKKAIVIIDILTAIFWLAVIVIGLILGFSGDKAMAEPHEGAEAVGFIFAALFIALFSVVGYGAAIFAAVGFLACILSIIIVCNQPRKGTVIGLGICSLIIVNIVGGILMLVYSKDLD